MKWIDEFKKFVLKGNMVDMAVGIIIGAAFGKVVNSLVNDIIMPPIGFIIGGVNFNELTLKLGSEVTIAYGSFINQCVNLLIIAGSIFVVIKLMNRLHLKKVHSPSEKPCPKCLMTIPVKATKCGHCTSDV